MVSALQRHHNETLIAQPAKQWQAFYTRNGARFFKDRHWLFQENMFAKELEPRQTTATWRLLETGCGAGNTLFPLVEEWKDKNAHFYACDFAKAAIQLIQVITSHDKLDLALK